MKTKIILPTVLFLTACASTHPGTIAKSMKGASQPVVISAEKQDSISDSHYLFVTFTVESKSDDMLRVKSTDIDFGDVENTRASVLVGKDLIAWGEAHEEEVKKAEHNNKLARVGMLLGGMGLALIGQANHNDALAAVGATTAIGGAGWELRSKIHQSIEKAHNPKLVPDEHIYAPFSVPAEKFVRKWAVIQHPKDAKIRHMNLTMTLEDGSEATYDVVLK